MVGQRHALPSFAFWMGQASTPAAGLQTRPLPRGSQWVFGGDGARVLRNPLSPETHLQTIDSASAGLKPRAG